MVAGDPVLRAWHLPLHLHKAEGHIEVLSRVKCELGCAPNVITQNPSSSLTLPRRRQATFDLDRLSLQLVELEDYLLVIRSRKILLLA